MEIEIAKGLRQDVPEALALIRELAKYERAEKEVSVSLAQMEEDGFGPRPVYEFLLARAGGQAVGLSLWYYRYSTWKGKRLYLEDIVVTEAWRGNGIGKRLLESTMKVCTEKGCTGMMWQVLDWNEPAIGFYRQFGTRFDSEWVNCHLEVGQIELYFKATGSETLPGQAR